MKIQMNITDAAQNSAQPEKNVLQFLLDLGVPCGKVGVVRAPTVGKKTCILDKNSLTKAQCKDLRGKSFGGEKTVFTDSEMKLPTTKLMKLPKIVKALVKPKKKNPCEFLADLNKTATAENSYSAFIKYCPDLFVIDCDDPDDMGKAAAQKLCEGCPWTKSSKGRHYYMFITDVPEFSRIENVFTAFIGDLIGQNDAPGNNIWEKTTGIITDYTDKESIPIKTFAEMSEHLNALWHSSIKTAPELQPEPAMVDAPTEVSNAESIASKKFGGYCPTSTELWDLLKRFPADDRTTWISVGMTCKGFQQQTRDKTKKKDYYEIWKRWSETCPEKFSDTCAVSTWGNINKPGKKVKGWTSMRRDLEKTYPDCWGAYLRENITEVIMSKHQIHSLQLLDIMGGVLDIVTDKSMDSDIVTLVAPDDSKQETMIYDQETGYWLKQSIKAFISNYIYTLPEKMHGEIDALRARYPQLPAEPKQGDPPDYGQALSRYRRFSSVYALCSEPVASSRIAQILQQKTNCPERFIAVDNNNEAEGGHARYLYAYADCRVNLITGERKKATRHEMLSETTGYNFPAYLLDAEDNPTEECLKLWEEIDIFMNSLLAERFPKRAGDKKDKDIVLFMYREQARSMPACNPWQRTPWLTGSGGNGKSKFMTFNKRLYGGHHATIKNSFWTGTDGSGDSTDNELASVVKHRMVTSSELDDKKKLNEMRVKSLVGEDSVKVRRNFCSPEELEPNSTYWIAMNKVPRFDGADMAMARRIVNIPFPYAFGPENKAKGVRNYSAGDPRIPDVDGLLMRDDIRDAYALRLHKVFREDLVKNGKLPKDCPYKKPKSVLVASQNLMSRQQGYFDDFVEWGMVEEPEDCATTYEIKKRDLLALHGKYCSPLDGEEKDWILSWKDGGERLTESVLTAKMEVKYTFDGKSFKHITAKKPSMIEDLMSKRGIADSSVQHGDSTDEDMPTGLSESEEESE